MGLLNVIRGLIPGGGANAVVQDSTALAIDQHHIPEEIRELLWFSDGPLSNYERQPAWESTSVIGGIPMTLSVSFFGTSEPSAISVSLPVARPSGEVERLGYYPNYEGMTPQQRWTYLDWLRNVDDRIDIGYVFVFYYGLERQLFGPQADCAVDSILRLRAHHKHKSFVGYSSNAVIAASLVANRSDWLIKFAETVDSASEVALSDVYLYAKYLYRFELSPVELMSMSSRVGFSNRRYIKDQPELFVAALQSQLDSKYGAEGLRLAGYDLDRCPSSLAALFANYSLDRDRTLLKVPVIVEQPQFRADAFELLKAAHESVNQHLKDARSAAGRQVSAAAPVERSV